jgi:hypothetical protein
MHQDDWNEWHELELFQLNQNDKEVCCLQPHLNVRGQIGACGRKKACKTCDGSTRGGQVCVLDDLYANALDQTGSRIFYALSAVENKLVYGADVSNAFGDARPPKQGFFIRPDQAFKEWWILKGSAPIPEGYVIPLLAALQGRPESPRLWEKHIDCILRKKLGFCSYCPRAMSLQRLH